MMPAAKPQKRRASRIRRADTLFGKIVRASGRCLICRSTTVIQCAHGFSRRYYAIRWDLRNAFALCRACHMHYTHNPLAWDDWLHERWGVDLYDELRALALRGSKPDLDELIPTLEAQAAAL